MTAKSPNPAQLLFSLLCMLSLSTCPSGASSVHSKVKAIHMSGHVRDQSTGKVIEAARIKVLPSTDNAIWRTDRKGEFSFWLANQGLDRIEIDAEGYGTLSLVPTTGTLRDVRLVRESATHTTPAQVSGKDTFPIVPPSQAVAPAILTADSGPKPSGSGSSWSPWYRLGVTKAPTGYAVSRVEFWLSGDGACGHSAECRQVEGDGEHVIWEFRLHGHNELGAPSRTFSVAHIQIIFRPR